VKTGRVVVCGIDGSAADAATVEVAAQLAVLAQAELALIAVAPLPEWTLEEARRMLELTADGLRDRVAVEWHLDSGNPLRRLAEFAARKRALLLVVGTRAPATGRPPSLVASGLTRGAPCPVVVVPEAAPVPALADAWLDE
jgi:nucleotide-binding universal stress UspA family protein